MLTFLAVNLNIVSYNKDTMALCFMFSAGTFLYVATAHILPEVQMGESIGKPLSWHLVILIAFGIIFPVFINVGHDH